MNLCGNKVLLVFLKRDFVQKWKWEFMFFFSFSEQIAVMSYFSFLFFEFLTKIQTFPGNICLNVLMTGDLGDFIYLLLKELQLEKFTLYCSVYTLEYMMAISEYTLWLMSRTYGKSKSCRRWGIYLFIFSFLNGHKTFPCRDLTVVFIRGC